MNADYPNPQIRLYSPEDLALADSGDPWMGTLILNLGTFSAAQLHTFYRVNGRHYIATLADDDQRVGFRAVDDASAIRFANCQWYGVESIEEETRPPYTYRTVTL